MKTRCQSLLAALVLAVHTICYGQGMIRIPVDVADLNVPTSILFEEQLRLQALALEKLAAISMRIGTVMENAKVAQSQSAYFAAEENQKIVWRLLAPFAVAAVKRDRLSEHGFQLTSVDGTKGRACISNGQCTQIDSATALMMILAGLIASDLGRTKPRFESAPFTGLREFTRKPQQNPSNALYAIWDAMLLHDEGGAVSKDVQDHAKDPTTIVSAWRTRMDKRRLDNPIADAIRLPIRCNLTKLFTNCSNS